MDNCDELITRKKKTGEQKHIWAVLIFNNLIINGFTSRNGQWNMQNCTEFKHLKNLKYNKNATWHDNFLILPLKAEEKIVIMVNKNFNRPIDRKEILPHHWSVIYQTFQKPYPRTCQPQNHLQAPLHCSPHFGKVGLNFLMRR